jgi:crossover junction endodeoxyribonuclease RuvC
MIILGIDPGVARVGWAVISTDHGAVRAAAYGCITTEKTEEFPRRLLTVHKALTILIRKYKPDCISAEELFFSTNVKTAISVGEARGIVLLAAAQANIPVISYTPNAVKRAIAGDGRADKKQVTGMVVRILKLRTAPKLDDTADALAIAMTHAYSYKIKKLI